MGIIFNYVLVAVVALAMSPFLTALVKRFSKETKVFTKDFMKDVKFDLKITTVFPLILISLFGFLGMTPEFIKFSFITILLVISFFVDLKAQIIPNETNFLGFIVGLAIAYIKMTTNYLAGLDLLLGMVTGAGIFLLIALFAFLVYKKVGMGLGDVKLMGMLGLFFGFANTVQIFVFSFFIGAIVSLFLLFTKIKKSDDYIPFGPFIVLAALITMFVPAGTTIGWIFNTLLI